MTHLVTERCSRDIKKNFFVHLIFVIKIVVFVLPHTCEIWIEYNFILQGSSEIYVFIIYGRCLCP